MIPVLITLAVLVLVCIGCVVFVPFHLSFAGKYAGKFSGSLRVTWLWGALKIEHLPDERKTSVYLLGMQGARFRTDGKSKEGRNRRAKPRSKRRRNVPGDLSNIPEAVRLAGRIVRSLSPRGTVEGVFGTGDPAQTGIIFGLVSAFLALVPLPVRLVPDFAKSVIRANGVLSVRIFIAGLLAIGIKEFFSPQGRKLMASVRGT